MPDLRQEQCHGGRSKHVHQVPFRQVLRRRMPEGRLEEAQERVCGCSTARASTLRLIPVTVQPPLNDVAGPGDD